MHYLKVAHYLPRVYDLDGAVLKYFIDYLVTVIPSLEDDGPEYLRWATREPEVFVKWIPSDAPPRTILNITQGDGRFRQEFDLRFPAPSMNAFIRLAKNQGALTRAKALMKHAAYLSAHPEVDPLTIKHLPKNSYGQPIWKRPMDYLTFADRYYKFALGRKGLPKSYQKYYE
jgi:hypothetical protein